MFHQDSQLIKTMTWIAQMAELQLYWVIGIVKGLIIFGLFPSTLSMIIVMRELIRKGETQSIRKFFFKTYKQEFRNANVIGLVVALVTVILIINFRLSSALIQPYGNYFFWLSYAVLVLWCVTCMYLLPIYSHFQLSLKQLFIQAIIVVFLCPAETLLLFLATLLFLWSVDTVAILVVLVSCAVYIYIIVRITNYSFIKVQKTIANNTTI